MSNSGVCRETVGVRYLVYPDRTSNKMGTRLDLSGYVENDRHDLDTVDHYRQFGLSRYIIQGARRLAEGMTGPDHKFQASLWCVPRLPLLPSKPYPGDEEQQIRGLPRVLPPTESRGVIDRGLLPNALQISWRGRVSQGNQNSLQYLSMNTLIACTA